MRHLIIHIFLMFACAGAVLAQDTPPAQEQQLQEELIPESDQGIENRQLPETEEEIQSEQEPTMHDQTLEPGQQEVPAQTEMEQTLQESQGMEGMQELPPMQLPQPVKQGLQNGQHSLAAIDKAYLFSGKALQHLLNSMQALPSDNLEPDRLYLIQLTGESGQKSMLYFTEQGELFREERM